MSDTNAAPEPKRPTVIGVLSLILAVLAIYFLSVGPVVRHYRHSGKSPPQWVEDLYQPLEMLDGSPLHPVLDSYLALWGVVINPHVGP
jgi:hypothetical protein